MQDKAHWMQTVAHQLEGAKLLDGCSPTLLFFFFKKNWGIELRLFLDEISMWSTKADGYFLLQWRMDRRWERNERTGNVERIMQAISRNKAAVCKIFRLHRRTLPTSPFAPSNVARSVICGLRSMVPVFPPNRIPVLFLTRWSNKRSHLCSYI